LFVSFEVIFYSISIFKPLLRANRLIIISVFLHHYSLRPSDGDLITINFFADLALPSTWWRSI